MEYKDLIGYSFKVKKDISNGYSYTNIKTREITYYFDYNNDKVEIYWYKINGEKNNSRLYYSEADVINHINKKTWIVETKYYRSKKLKRINEKVCK